MKGIGGLVDPKRTKAKKEAVIGKEETIIAKTHLLFQLETFHLVFVLKGSLLDLKSLETLETPFDLGGQIFNVARALSEEAG